jgi:multidrug resistance efflux pump
MITASVPFSKSLRSLHADHPRRSATWLILSMCIVILWCGWLAFAHISVYESSESARLEASEAIESVDAPSAGKVVAVHMATGQLVRAGDLLVQLDASPERLQLEEERIHGEALRAQIGPLRRQLATEEHTLLEMGNAAQAALVEGMARSKAESATASFLQGEAARLASLHENGLTTESNFLRGKADAQRQGEAAEAARLALARLERDSRVQETSQRSRIEGMKLQLAQLEGSIETSQALIHRLQDDIRQREIRAPGEGTIGEAVELRVGAVVQQGDKLATIVSDGNLKAVGTFAAASALGQIRAGQPGLVRLSGFPWIEYGSIPAIVRQVGAESRNGKIRVELDLRHSQVQIPLQHGLPAEVEVQVDRVSPATLLLRAVAGRMLN